MPPTIHARATLDCHQAPLPAPPLRTRCLYVPPSFRPNGSALDAEAELESKRISGLLPWPSKSIFASERLKYHFLGYGEYIDHRPPPACEDNVLWHYHMCKPWHFRCWFERLAAGVAEQELQRACGCYPHARFSTTTPSTKKRESYDICDECFLVKYAQLHAWHQHFARFI